MKLLIRAARIKSGLKVKDVASILQIDVALVSKFEAGTRIPTFKQIQLLASCLEIPQDELQKEWLKQKLLSEVKEYQISDTVVSMLQEDLATYNAGFKRVISRQIQDILDEIDELKTVLQFKRKFDSTRIKEALSIEYTFESNKIEGNTLTLRETDLVVNQGLTISGKSMREHLEAINHQEAIDYVYHLLDKKSQLSEREILTIHNLILRGIHSEEAGKYRQVQVMIQGSKHIPPDSILVKDQMQQLMNWYYKNLNLHPVILAAEMHERIVTVHPFIDGNGRTSRLIMNLILLKHGYVIANIKGDYEVRMRYYEALENAQINQSKDDFIEFIAKVELDCIKRYLSILK